MKRKPNGNNEKKTITLPVFTDRARRISVLIIGILSVVLIAALLFVPFYKVKYYDSYGGIASSIVRAVDVLRIPSVSMPPAGGALYTIEALILFIAISLLTMLGGVLLFAVARAYAAREEKFYGSAQALIIYATIVCSAFWISGTVFCSLKNAYSSSREYSGTDALILCLCIVLVIFFAFITRKVDLSEDIPKPKKTAVGARIEIFIYATVISTLAVICALGDILYVKFNVEIGDVFFNGFKALRGVDQISGGLQLLAFFVIVFVFINIALFLISLSALIGRSRLYYHLALTEIIVGSVSTLTVGLFGKYFAIAEEINADILRAWIEYQLDRLNYEGSVDLESLGITYDVQSPSHWWVLGALAVVIIFAIRKPYSRGTKNELTVTVRGASAANDPSLSEDRAPADSVDKPSSESFDPCPAFTELDRLFEKDSEKLAEDSKRAFEDPTLPGIVNFVVDYARDSRLHLYYTPEDIATFMAGLGSTRLTILQGMSGTGKTSLPKIFAEAIMGGCDIVEVESAWRDKNELLGYYNEFSRVYTPKKFTCALYQARLIPERPTFIVLDEMNLSRIEYYFSDFLSLMEHEEDRREIRLLGTPIFRRQDGNRYRYRGLVGGTNIKIPGNVWFVGTANRDESTFEISDKVYDRAHTMNFNKRAPKVRSLGEPIPARFVSTEVLLSLFDQAKNTVYFDIENYPVIAEVEALLSPYNISFGNRIANQIESFVRIYAACLGGSEAAIADGLERILLSKVVAKLEFKSVENKEYLADEFDRLGLARCRDFVMSLNED